MQSDPLVAVGMMIGIAILAAAFGWSIYEAIVWFCNF